MKQLLLLNDKVIRWRNICLDPKKIATKGFSTDLSSIGCQLLHIKSPNKSNFQKMFFQDGHHNIKITLN